LQTLRWAAVHYVAPLAAVLPKAGPPNLAQVGRKKLPPPPTGMDAPPALAELVGQLSAGRRPPTSFLAGSGPWTDTVAALAAPVAGARRNVLIIVATAAECSTLAGALTALFGTRVVATTSSAGAAERTRAWSQARGTPGTIVVGTPEIALWPASEQGLAIIVEAGRRAMKSRQSPTLHVREIMRRRASVERFGLAFLGQVPTLEAVAGGAKMVSPETRTWPLVEVIDRNDEPPTSNPLAEATRTAIAAAVRREEPVFVFVSRRGYAPATRCTSCSELRRCAHCGSSPGQGATCERCGTANGPCIHCGGATFAPVGAAAGRVLEELRRSLGESVSAIGQGGLVQVGTERDIPAAGSVALSVVVDVDSMLLRPHYRAEEDTLRIVARVASTVRRGRGHRCVIQTRLPEHRVLNAMRHGSGIDIVADWLIEREAEQLPPFGQLLAVELTEAGPQADVELRETIGPEAAVFGPGSIGERTRWLVQAPDLRLVKVRLRSQVQKWRDRGIKVRVDADPLDV